METIGIISSSLTSAGIVAALLTDPLWIKVISAVSSFATTFIAAYCKFFGLQRVSIEHKATASKLISIRDKYKTLLVEIKLKLDTPDNLLEKYRLLSNDADLIYTEAPITTSRAVKLAGTALKIKKDEEFSDDEINSIQFISFLSPSLRKDTTNE